MKKEQRTIALRPALDKKELRTFGGFKSKAERTAYARGYDAGRRFYKKTDNPESAATVNAAPVTMTDEELKPYIAEWKKRVLHRAVAAALGEE